MNAIQNCVFVLIMLLVYFVLGVSELIQNTWGKQSSRKKAPSEASTLPPALPTSPTSARTFSLAESVSQMMGVMSQDEEEDEEELVTQYVSTSECCITH